MKEKVIDTIKKYKLIEKGDKIVLGVSGGPDSIAMLDILKDLRNKFEFEIYVCHLNHMIRGQDAINDQKYVEQYCNKNQIEFFTKNVNIIEISNNQKIGTEECGRNARYNFFEEILEKTKSNKIATAHNKNDNAETVLMHLLRGSGISGLKGIKPIRNNKFIKPLIECDRKEIEAYCKQKNLNPCIDKTNFENTYTRNKIRNIVIPYIKKEFNPNIIETLFRLSEVVSSEDEFLDRITQKEFENIVLLENEHQIDLKLKEFNLLDNVIKNRLILLTTKKLFGTVNGIEKINIDDIIKMCNKNIGNKFLMPNKNLKVMVKDKKISFYTIGNYMEL